MSGPEIGDSDELHRLGSDHVLGVLVRVLGYWCCPIRASSPTFGKGKPDRILVFTKADGTGLTFIKRRPDGALGKLFVSFTYTPNAFNGWRIWFCCPSCGKRCRCLYGVNTLRCRKCLGLVYASQSERTYWRAQRRADSIRRCLGGNANDMDPKFPDKPKRMRWRSYSALKRKYEALRSHFLAGEVELIRGLSLRLGRKSG